MKPSLKSEEGSTLLDVVAAFGILGIMTYATLLGTSQTEAQDGHQQQLTSAITLGERVMEELFLETSTGPDLAPGVHSRDYSFSGVLVPSGGVFKATWTVTQDQPMPAVSQVRVRIQWQEGAVQREISLVNFRS